MKERTRTVKPPRGGMHDLAFYERHKSRTPQTRWKKASEQKTVLLKCSGCGNEKITKVGNNWNPRVSGGMLSTCKEACESGTGGTFHKFVRFINATTAPKTKK